MKTNLRLIVAVVTSLLDEIIIVALVLWVLPKAGINLGVGWLTAIIIGFAIFAVFTFTLGTQALAQKPMKGLTSMIDSKGTITCPLTPEGLVKIKGELWLARAESGAIQSGEEVMVVGQKGLKLIVRRKDPRDTGT